MGQRLEQVEQLLQQRGFIVECVAEGSYFEPSSGFFQFTPGALQLYYVYARRPLLEK